MGMKYVSLVFLFMLGVLVWQWTMAMPNELPKNSASQAIVKTPVVKQPQKIRPAEVNLPPLPADSAFIAPGTPPNN